MRETYWKITLVNGEVIDDNRCYVCARNNDVYKFKDIRDVTCEEIVGPLLRKKKVETVDEVEDTLYIIPIKNILKIELRPTVTVTK